MSYYILQNDETKGPYTLGQLRAMWNSGAITSETLYSQEGYSEWLPLSTIIHELEPAPAPPPIPPSPPQQFLQPAPRPQGKGVGILGVCLLAFLLGVLILGAIMLALVALPSSSSGSDGTKTTRTMSIEVRWGFDSIRIKNTGSPDLAGRTMTVYINGMPPFAYKADWEAPALGETVRIPLSVFVKKGSRFSPTTQAVSEAWVGGAGYDYDRYRK